MVATDVTVYTFHFQQNLWKILELDDKCIHLLQYHHSFSCIWKEKAMHIHQSTLPIRWLYILVLAFKPLQIGELGPSEVMP
jgi:hypothetical protein